MKATGKYSLKPYKCTGCSQEKEIGTNHWGECYPYCNICNKQTVWECLEEVPEGYTKPKPWKWTTLGEVAEIL